MIRSAARDEQTRMSGRLLAPLAGIASSLAGMRIEDFTGRAPEFDLFAYFEGRSRAHGIVEDRFGRLRREFTVDLVGRLDGSDMFRLDEDFAYADGATERRSWRIRRVGEGRFEGRADDVDGAAEGRAAGNALHWRYRLNLPVGGRVWTVDFDDWMFLQPDGVLINRARLSKWAIAVGEVTLVFRREPARPVTPADRPPGGP